MSIDGARHELVDALALAQEQMTALAELQKKRAALAATATAAENTVAVTVNAHGLVTSTIIDETYLDDFDFADLGGYVTAAAQAAMQEIGRRSAELLAPLTARRNEMPSLSDIVAGAPDLRSLIPDLRPSTSSSASAHGAAEDWDCEDPFPSVRS